MSSSFDGRGDSRLAFADACADRSSWIDVRDLGLAHALAVKTPEAGGERIIVSQSVFKLQDFGE